MFRIRATSYHSKKRHIVASSDSVDKFYEIVRKSMTNFMYQYVLGQGVYNKYSGIPYFDVGAKEYTEDRYGNPVIIFEIVMKHDKSGNWERVGDFSMCAVDTSTGEDIHRLTREDKKYIQDECREIVDNALSAKGFI